MPVRRGLLGAPRGGSGACGLRGLGSDLFRRRIPRFVSLRTADLVPDDITIDNLDHSYYVLIQPSDSSLRIAGVVFGYVLQVSPAPASTTFNDVPTGHQFFRFVEALAASGITAGCGGNDFCPNEPLTRGQMAVFLAKALGLQWPQ